MRQLFRQDRFAHPELVPLMNKVYRPWNDLQNHFRPTFKLLSKQKKGGRYKKLYKTPQTPYARLLQRTELTSQAGHHLKLLHQTLNP